MNEYEQARLRYEKISRSHAHIKAQAQAIIDWANDEWSAASAGLARYEESPGVPLPAYRQDQIADLAEATPWTLGEVLTLMDRERGTRS